MIDYRIINFSHSLRDLETGQAAERFFSTLASSHKDIKLDDASNVGSSDWKLVDNKTDGSVWVFEDKVEVKIDSPPVDRGRHRFARMRTIWIDKENRGFSLAPVKRCISSVQDKLEEMTLPLFLCIKPYELEHGYKEIFHHSKRRQQALVQLVLSLGFQYMDQDSWNIACEGSTIEFQERNREYPLEIPFLIWLPKSINKNSREYFCSFLDLGAKTGVDY